MFENKNDKQVHFNQIKGRIIELNDDEKYCSVAISVGHENLRQVNFACRKKEFEVVKNSFVLEDFVVIQFRVTSRKKNDRWYTTATLLDMIKAP